MEQSFAPWERSDIIQAHYMDSATTALSAAEQEALLALWAPQSNTVAQPIGDLDIAILNSRVDRRTHSSLSNSYNEAQVRTPLTAPIFQNRPVDIPAGPKTEPKLPSFVAVPNTRRSTHPSSAPDTKLLSSRMRKSPPASPDSGYGSWTSSPTYDSTRPIDMPPTQPRTTFISNNNENTPLDINDNGHSAQHRKRRSKLARWKSALKDFFHHDSVDNSELEFIEVTHWTEQ